MSSYPSSSPDLNVAAASVTTPTDRVRWPAIFAGLFAALSTLVVLAVLGAAVAGSSWDPGDSARSFGIGAGIWAAISALIAFFVGGMLAARTAAVRGHNNGTLNGAMVWVVAIPLMLYMLVGPLLRATGSAVSTGVQAASNAAGQMVDREDRTGDDRVEERARQARSEIQSTTQRVTQAATDPNNQKRAAETTAKSAWGTLVSLVLGLAAAAAGGYFGSRDRRFAEVRRDDSDRPHTTTVTPNRP